ncbi:hypothetical protein NMY22_g15735 [Coprinellus aureogranulatus]|nr:hypothetical protein NMY22_g15735 [Coprinellus aureogranulatus]
MAFFKTSFCALLLSVPFALAATLTETISQEPELSVLWSGISELPADAVEQLNTITGATFLAPSNDAINAWIPTIDPSSLTPAFYESFVRYHFLTSVLKAGRPQCCGGIIADDSSLDPTSLLEGPTSSMRLGPAAGVTKPDLEYDGGVIHVIDHVLNLPLPGTQTAEALGLTVAAGFLKASNLTELFDTTPKLTSFPPTDAAFAAAGIDPTAHDSPDDAAAAIDALKYHVIIGDLRYSTAVEDGQDYQTLLGVPVTVHKKDGQLLINDVPVEQGNVIVANGVAHVLSGVLVPPTAPEPTQTA